MAVDEARLAKLTKKLDDVLEGKSTVTSRTALLFLESIYSQPDRALCLNKLALSPAGLSSLQTACSSNLKLSTFNTHSVSFIDYLRAPGLEGEHSGEHIESVLRAITSPPTFWDAFAQAYRDGKLVDTAIPAFAWLLLQLVSFPGDDGDPFRDLAQEPGIVNGIVSSPDAETRSLGYQLKHLVETRSFGTFMEDGPGGRHDNDYADFRKITILPTPDEIASQRPEFLRTAKEVEETPFETSDVTDGVESGRLDPRVVAHLDNQFRLYRADMLHALRDEIQIALGQKDGRHRGMVVNGMKLVGMYGKALKKNERGRHDKWGLVLACPDGYDLWFFLKDKPTERLKWLQDDRNKRYIRDMSLSALIMDGRAVSFPVVRRIEPLLAMQPPHFVLQMDDERAFLDTFCSFRTAKNVQLVQVDTPIFAYEPVLKALQGIDSIALASELFLWNSHSSPALSDPHPGLQRILEAIKSTPSSDLSSLIDTPKPIFLDDAQTKAFEAGLTQKVSLIQGPPGTGKSKIGALLTKTIHDATKDTVLVSTYTNHALDQFLEELLDIGIPSSSIVRLGSKSTERTRPLLLKNKPRVGKFTRADWNAIESYRNSASRDEQRLTKLYSESEQSPIPFKHILAHIEFEDSDFYEALSVPALDSEDDMKQVGSDGKDVSDDYLISRWAKGEDAGVFSEADSIVEMAVVWSMPVSDRRKKLAKWEEAFVREQAQGIFSTGQSFDANQMALERKFAQGELNIIRTVRIVGCTTTAAAKHAELLRVASPGVLVVEEAGEILESHVLTALGKQTQRLILIGDHKQLRPKVENYQLTVEKGDGYDLNCSLFERSVLKGYPHVTLQQQHRMRPEIASYPRRLTYPELSDAPSTLNRPNLRGVRDNIVFITHTCPEEADVGVDVELGHRATKKNAFEVDMVLKILRYLAQQGYGTDKIVILTPYLGQLHALRESLQKDNDPVLNDLDSSDLVRAGLLSAAAAKVAKKPIRLATVDNYQGEESDIVIASLVRSNSANNIGFMHSPERLNVLLSRARDALIMVGDMNTFSNSRKGKDLWRHFFELLKQDGHIYDGLPVECARHPGHCADLASPEDFDLHAPEGGCKEPCSEMLSCGVHACPSTCHQISDHSKTKCEQVIEDTCASGHARTWLCRDGSPSRCVTCERAAAEAERRRKEKYEAEQKLAAEKQKYTLKLAELNAGIESAQDTSRSPSEKEWQRQKDVEGAVNPSIDAIMNMPGHENLKAQVLRVKAKVAAPFNIMLLGNTGNAKTPEDELADAIANGGAAGRPTVVIAAYDQDADQLKAVQPRRLQEEVVSPDAYLRILQQELQKYEIGCAALTVPGQARSKMTDRLASLSSLPFWSSKRDLQTLSKAMARTFFTQASQHGVSGQPTLSDSDALVCLDSMLVERRSQTVADASPSAPLAERPSRFISEPSPPAPPPPRPLPSVASPSPSTRQPATTVSTTSESDIDDEDLDSDDLDSFDREPSVLGAVWRQLQADKRAERRRREAEEAALNELKRAVEEARAAEKSAKALHIALAKRARVDGEAAGLLEQQRVSKQEAATEVALRARALEAEEQRQAEAREREIVVQNKLREMGVCPDDHRWIRQGSSGYRCAGGKYFVSSAELGL